MKHKILSEAAQAAKEIRKILKTFFPAQKFSVRSENFTGGNSITVTWENGPTEHRVESKISQYCYGHFDGMTDCYIYSNGRNDIPQVKYLSYDRTISSVVLKKAFEQAKKTYHLLENINHLHDSLPKTGYYNAKHFLMRGFKNYDLSDGYKFEELELYL